MPKFLIDVNLPYHLSIWNLDHFIHQSNINDEWFDEQIWVYTKEKKINYANKNIRIIHQLS
jgi:hypothetical protein